LRLSVLAISYIACLAGCHGKASFDRGDASFRRGRYREAYLHYWEAYRAGPDSERFQALRLAGRRVAEEELERGLAAERDGDLESALGRLEMALEYDPSSSSILGAEERVSRSLRAWRSATAALENLRSGGGPPLSPWEELDLLLALVRHPSYPGEPERELRAAAARAAARLVSELPPGALSGEVPADAAELARVEEASAALLEAVEQRMLREEEDELSGDPSSREVASWRVSREVLRDAAEAARAALARAGRGAAGLERLERARELELEGDLAGAIEAYREASKLHPGLDAARAGARRSLARLLDEGHRSALAACRGRDWKKARESLESVLRFRPGDAEAAALLASCRAELAGQRIREARRFEDSGLSGNALVAYHLAFAADPDGPAVTEALRRLEDRLYARLRPRWKVEVKPSSAAARSARRDLWGVSEEAIASFERVMALGAESVLGGGSWWGAAKPETIRIEEVDFSARYGDMGAGLESARHVESLELVENPDLEAARARFEGARRSLDRARILEIDSAAPKRRLAEELAALARDRAEQAGACLASIPDQVPVMTWGSAAFPVARRTFRAELACRYRLGVESRWVAASIELEDRCVDGDPDRNIPPDPDDLLSRAEALRLLAPRAGEKIARDAEAVIEARHEAYYREALSRVESGSFEVAVENLVTFLYSRRDREDALFEEAARLLEALSGCNLPAIWEARKGA